LEIIQPNIRAVNTQLYSPREKEELKGVVSIMTAYNLTYKQDRTPDGQYVYK
jgi:chromosome transmission fidelity protein 18